MQDFYEPKQELKARLQMVEQDGPVEVLIMDHLEKKPRPTCSRFAERSVAKIAVGSNFVVFRSPVAALRVAKRLQNRLACKYTHNWCTCPISEICN